MPIKQEIPFLTSGENMKNTENGISQIAGD
jgi:hypothetical protein